ncbi:MAG TPA: ABC transporter ATP-binding protein [Longimicrobiales bacterium]|nr:ABC transporter ATP-binding protein [Longimicrobiales bacterium]
MNPRPVIQVAGVAFAYPGGHAVLEDVSFDVGAGERVGLVGPNGAGKSTLLHLLVGLEEPSAGTVVVAGIPVRPGRLEEVRARMGMVFQDPDDQLFLPTLVEDVAFGPLNQGVAPAEARRLAEAQLELLGLGAMAERAAHHTSGGERRRAALATALVSRPELLLLDEPTDGLDARGRHAIVGILRERPEALVVATHDLDVVRAVCPRTLVLDGGKLVADGPTERILADAAFLARHGIRVPLD